MTFNYKLLVISAILLLIGAITPVTYVCGIFHRIAFPIQFGIRGAAVSLNNEIVFLRKIKSIKEELFELYKIKERAISVESKMKEVELENAILREQLGFSESKNQKILMAYVTGSSFGSISTSLSLNVGSYSGVRVGNAVSSENYLIGVVDSVSQNSCTVKLLNDPATKISALSQNSRAKGLIVGNYGTTVLMKNILINEPLDLGDLIITSGEDVSIPKGLIIGEVAKINFKEQEILKSADVELGINPRKLEVVFVLN